ncbi:hypothetical protein [Kribbella sp. NPDC003557]|uniref:hypothetical protein n=1 Tax=Kribbella sp. NPDC003557 TaxID=3154449 RepID=UPI0033BCC55D
MVVDDLRGAMFSRSRSKDRQPRVRWRGALAPPSGFDSLVSVGVGVSGPVALWASAEGAPKLHERDEQPGGASFPRTRPSAEPAVALAAYNDSLTAATVAVIPALSVAYPHVQQFPDGAFLVVGARCSWTDSGPEQNAIVIGADGRIIRRGCLGDGLQHVQVAADGTIWAGYFDEGVFGNLGWGGPNSPDPLGAAGIVAWSRVFEKTWELDPDEGLVADCYALNVAPDAVWACTYTDFPVVRIADGHEQVHDTEDVTGPSGIIAAHDRVGLIGTYRDPSRLIVGSLTDGVFTETSRTNLWAPDGAALPMAQVHCRGSVTHFFSNRDWYTFDLNEFE